MSELGAWLRESRETKELSLAEAAAATHVRVTHLAAIEEGRRDDLPEAVYLRGLVTTYGQFLGLDGEKVRELFAKEYGRPTKPGSRVDSHQPLSEPLRDRRSWLLAITTLLLLLAVAVGLWWYWPEVSDWGKALLARIAEPAAQTSRVLPASTATSAGVPSLSAVETSVAVTTAEPVANTGGPTSAALPLPTPAPPDTPVPAIPTPTATSTPIPGIWLGVQVSSTAWMRITVDGEVAYEGTREGGDAEVWFGEQSVALLTGNAGGTSLTINGEPVDPLGGPGEVAGMTWTWDGERLTSKPSE